MFGFSVEECLLKFVKCLLPRIELRSSRRKCSVHCATNIALHINFCQRLLGKQSLAFVCLRKTLDMYKILQMTDPY